MNYAYYAICFENEDLRAEFEALVEYVGWAIYPLCYAGKEAYTVEVGSDDGRNTLEYLHNLGAFKWLEEK